MKGIVFCMLEEFVISLSSEEAYEEILSKCELKTKDPFVGMETYPDEDLMEIFTKTVQHFNLNPQKTLKDFGRFAFPLLAQKCPEFLEGHEGPKSFLKTVHSIIHVEVRKIFPGAQVPVFEYEDENDGELTMVYKSKRGMCGFAHGLIEGTSDFFKTPITISMKEELGENDEKNIRFDLKFGEAT